LKAYISIFILILLVIGTAGCVIENNFHGDNSTKNFTGYGVSFNHPGNWMVSTDNSTGFRTIVVSKISNSTFDPTQIAIQLIPTNKSEKDIISGFRDIRTPGWTKISNNTRTIANNTAYEWVYLVKDHKFGGTWRIHQIVLVKNGVIYSIMLQSPVTQFDTAKPVFDMVINSLKVV
jgi:hypothetical protein